MRERLQYIIPQEVGTLKDYSTEDINLTEVISPRKKAEMFDPLIASMKKIADQRGIYVPDNILDRLFLVNHDTFYRVCRLTSFSENSYGVCLSNRLCFFDVTEAQRDKYPLEESIEELWHSLTYAEQWCSQDGKPNLDLPKRIGIALFPPDRNRFEYVHVGLNALNEGFTKILVEQTLKEAGQKAKGCIQTIEFEGASLICGKIGIDPLFSAMFEPEGIKKLSTTLSKHFGQGALRKIAWCFGRDLVNRERFGVLPESILQSLLKNYLNGKDPFK